MPLRIRHGSVQPFSVATGWYGRPLGGMRGACMAAESLVAISGSAVKALFATAPAATASPAPLKNVRRESMMVPWRLRRGAAEQSCVELGLGDPEIAHACDVVINARGLFAGIGQQFEDADLRCVVAQQILLRDGLAQRQHLIALLPGDI